MESTEIIFALAIAILYPFFFNKLANKVTNYDEIRDACKDFQMYTPGTFDFTAEYKECDNERTKKLNEAEFNKHLILLGVALTGIILSSIIQTKSTKAGVGFGGIFTLIIALMFYWHKYNETTKLIVLGASLLFVIYFSIRLYKVDSIADIFTFNLGKL